MKRFGKEFTVLDGDAFRANVKNFFTPLGKDFFPGTVSTFLHCPVRRFLHSLVRSYLHPCQVAGEAGRYFVN